MTEENEKTATRKNYPKHVTRKKETKPRAKGGGRKPGIPNSKPRKKETKPRKTKGVKRVAVPGGKSINVWVKHDWYLKHRQMADSEGISFSEHCRKILNPDAG